MSNKKSDVRRELVEFGKKISAQGLVVGPGGNISARSGGTIFIKASGIAFEEAREEHYLAVDLKTGTCGAGDGLKPSCELFFHLGCYLAREDVRAVIHTHPPLATAFACAGVAPRPMSPDFVALVGAEVPLLKYIPPASRKLAEAVVKKIRNHQAVLLQNHGLITVGANLREAYYRNLLVESACLTQLVCRLMGRPRFLSPKEVREIAGMAVEKYRQRMLKKTKV